MAKQSTHNDCEYHENDDPESETAMVDAKKHIQFFKDIFQFYELSFQKWVICLLWNYCSTNKRILKLTGTPFVKCNSHQLILDIRSLISSTPDLQYTIFAVENVMREVKGKIRNTALICNFTNLKPILELDKVVRFLHCDEQICPHQKRINSC